MNTHRSQTRSQPATAITDVIEQLGLNTGDELPARRPTVTPQWLAAKFGYGEQPLRRKRFYAWLCGCILTKPASFEKMIKSVARSAESADNPGNYFVAVVMRRGRELGYIIDHS